ncbi:hypothetical protein [Paenibacillus sp. P36]|uniref:hypothetical protein n=1 Tax=Paenibacillus sp. P36 TaxID=3342538 RepID=UPI0038B2EAA5
MLESKLQLDYPKKVKKWMIPMITKIAKVFSTIILLYVLFLSFLVFANPFVLLKEFSTSIGLTEKVKIKAITTADSEKWDSLIREETSKGTVSAEKLKELHSKVENEAQNYTYRYKINYYAYFRYLVVGALFLKWAQSLTLKLAHTRSE